MRWILWITFFPLGVVGNSFAFLYNLAMMIINFIYFMFNYPGMLWKHVSEVTKGE